jgi:kinase
MTPFIVDLGFGEESILRGLTEANIVGRGGSGRVYHVTFTNRLNGAAGAVAVKQIWTVGKLDGKLEREFESDAGILYNVQHNNIVRLLCCLSGAEAKLLVYDYMDNGSLDKWLHGDALAAGGHPIAARAQSARRAPLDWPTRLKVVVGAAQGLCYMHHECVPPIVHCDVKTSNILLDSVFRAKVADFDLAWMLAQAGAPYTMSAVAGSFGYMAPVDFIFAHFLSIRFWPLQIARTGLLSKLRFHFFWINLKLGFLGERRVGQDLIGLHGAIFERRFGARDLPWI